MKCPHCAVVIQPNWCTGIINTPSSDEVRPEDYGLFQGPIVETAWIWVATKCPACKDIIIDIQVIDVDYPPEPLLEVRAYPRFPKRKPVSDAVPSTFKADYIEACNVLPASAKASAALSRRLLQAILSDQGYEADTLSKQIVAILEEDSPEKVLPSAIRSTIDAVRHLGNLAAHPTADKASLAIIDVDPDEAEWCLEIIEALFEHYYSVESSEAKRRLANLNAKLSRAPGQRNFRS